VSEKCCRIHVLDFRNHCESHRIISIGQRGVHVAHMPKRTHRAHLERIARTSLLYKTESGTVVCANKPLVNRLTSSRALPAAWQRRHKRAACLPALMLQLFVGVVLHKSLNLGIDYGNPPLHVFHHHVLAAIEVEWRMATADARKRLKERGQIKIIKLFQITWDQGQPRDQLGEELCPSSRTWSS
jgi:hypothetical protein